jgi:hypothetical protein
LANPNSHTSRPRPDRQTQHQNRFPRAHATVLARLLAGRGVRFSCSLQMRTYVSWAGSSDRETIFWRFYRTESLSYPEPCSRNRRYIRFLKFSSYSSKKLAKTSKREAGMDGGQNFPTGDLLNPAMIMLSQHMLTATLNNKVMQHEGSSIPPHKKGDYSAVISYYMYNCMCDTRIGVQLTAKIFTRCPLDGLPSAHYKTLHHRGTQNTSGKDACSSHEQNSHSRGHVYTARHGSEVQTC